MRLLNFCVLSCFCLVACSDSPNLEDLDMVYAEVMELAGDGSCDEESECSTLAVGSKACGGPSGYIVYCASAVDEAALIDKVDEYTQLEADYNVANDIVSTCDEEQEPGIEFIDGVCTAIY